VVESVPRPEAVALTFVPPDTDRTLQRGHHTAGRLARKLARRWDLALVPALERRRPMRPQRGLSLPERRRNVAGAFAARANPPRTVCLVDDVYTTGATAAGAASALKARGARRVEVVTFARAVR
jgi:predicted amidophosphoribosyltransferase